MDWTTAWYILKCQGCDFVFAMSASSNSEDYHSYYDEYGLEKSDYVKTYQYLPAISKRSKPDWLTPIGIEGVDSVELDQILLEIYGALNQDLKSLAAVGIRTAFDISAEALGIDPSISFAAKLDGLVSSGKIDQLNRNRLEGLVEAGSASAHRGWQPETAELYVLMDVLEHFIESTFVLPRRQASLDERLRKVRNRVPKRQSKELLREGESSKPKAPSPPPA